MWTVKILLELVLIYVHVFYQGKNVEMVTADSEFKGIIKLINQVFSENQSAVHR